MLDTRLVTPHIMLDSNSSFPIIPCSCKPTSSQSEELYSLLFCSPIMLTTNKLVNSLDLAKGSRDRWKRQSDTRDEVFKTRIRGNLYIQSRTSCHCLLQNRQIFCPRIMGRHKQLWLDDALEQGWQSHGELPTYLTSAGLGTSTYSSNDHTSVTMSVYPS
jgi:hypothetical protein